MDALLKDVRFAIRMMARSPGVTILMVVCLALGIGVNGTVYSLVDTMVIRPLPFRAPGQLVRLTPTKRSEGIDSSGVSHVELTDWKERTHVFADMGAVAGRRLTLSDRGEPERLVAALVTATRANRDLVVYARLKPAVSLDAARQDVRDAADRLASEYPENKGWSADAKPMRDDLIESDVRLIVLTMMGAVTLVLLIACANVANRLWPGRTDIVGRRFRLLDDKQPALTVVGVVGDFRLFAQSVRPEPYAFIPYPNKPTENTGLTIRVAGRSPGMITGAVRAEIRQSDPTLAASASRSAPAAGTSSGL